MIWGDCVFGALTYWGLGIDILGYSEIGGEESGGIGEVSGFGVRGIRRLADLGMIGLVCCFLP